MIARLASQNPHKLEELRAALPGWEIELLDAHDYPPEDGATYLDNARIKARYGRSVDGGDAWILAEDSGIEVDALGGRPGVASARWSPSPIEDLLRELAGVADRRARYRCELVALSPDGEEVRGSGVLEGRIADAPRGDEGFGYDPIFVPEGESRTVAELGNDWKRANSHRARAVAALAAALGSR